MADTEEKNGSPGQISDRELPWWPEGKQFSGWLSRDSSPDLALDDDILEVPVPGPPSRLNSIKESHALLKQFTSVELKILLNMKRNASEKAWSLREDLVVLTLPMSNREIADYLKDRNKEAVKKRLQLLRTKGLIQRRPVLSFGEDESNGDEIEASGALSEAVDVPAETPDIDTKQSLRADVDACPTCAALKANHNLSG